jgi:uncharacterized protein YndB with AHSA1/START domain
LFPTSAWFTSIPFPTPRAASADTHWRPIGRFSSCLPFAENDGKTTVTIRWIPHEATDKERETFEKGKDSMQAGWSGTLDQLETYLNRA